jgi:hypothetical protein
MRSLLYIVKYFIIIVKKGALLERHAKMLTRATHSRPMSNQVEARGDRRGDSDASDD